MKRTYFLILGFCILFACKKDDNNTSPEAPIGTTWVSSSIKTNEIGGSNLSVLTAYNLNATINKSSFKTIISQEGTQIVFVVDGNNNVRGLSYTVKAGNGYTVLPIDANSTVNSLFLILPGMMSTSPTETMNNLSTISAYNKFKNYIQNNLPNKALGDLLANTY